MWKAALAAFGGAGYALFCLRSASYGRLSCGFSLVWPVGGLRLQSCLETVESWSFLIGVLSSNTFNIAAPSVALIVLALLLFWPERPGSTPAFCREAESHFGKIGSNISVEWYRYEK